MILLFLFSCKQNDSSDATINDSLVQADSLKIINSDEPREEVLEELSNERFRKVTIEKVDKNKFQVKGQAQVFEATINWSVEDGHYILKRRFCYCRCRRTRMGEF